MSEGCGGGLGVDLGSGAERRFDLGLCAGTDVGVGAGVGMDALGVPLSSVESSDSIVESLIPSSGSYCSKST